MRIKYLFLLIYVGSAVKGFSQKEAGKWYFGYQVAMDFSQGQPSALNNSNMIALTSSATISTKKGRLLFYTNGEKIWDSTHTVMPNGSGLLGDDAAFQSSIIIPFPDSAHLYYVFYNDVPGGNGLRYSIVNMNLNSGKGDIVSGKKNILLLSLGCETLTAIKHENWKDYWLLTNKLYTDSIFAYKVSTSGISLPVKSYTGLKLNTLNRAKAVLKISPNGKKVAFVGGIVDTGIIADFDASNGLVSNPWFFDVDWAWSTEFSSQSNYLYVTRPGFSVLEQYSVNSNSLSAFRASRKTVDSANLDRPYGLQLGPDGKIYIACGTAYAHTIDDPNAKGSACNPKKNVLYLTRTTREGYPSFIQSYFRDLTIKVTNHCSHDTARLYANITEQADSAKWNFGDTSSGAQNYSTAKGTALHAYKTPGYYTVKAIAYFKYHNDTVFKTFYVKPPFTKFTGKDTQFCNNFSYLVKSSKSGIAYKWSTGASTASISVSSKGKYILVLTDSNLCINRDTMEVKNPVVKAKFTLVGEDTVCRTFNRFYLTDNSSYTDDNAKNNTWSFGDTSIIYDTNFVNKKYASAGNFTIKLRIDSKEKCSDSISFPVRILPSADIGFTISKDKQCLKGNAFSFTNTSVCDKGSKMTYLWSLGDTLKSTYVHYNNRRFTKDTSYVITLIATTDLNCKDTISKTVVVYPNATVVFSPSVISQCMKGNTVNFSNSSTIKNDVISAYKWDFGDSTYSTNPAVTGKTYSKADSFRVKLLTITSNGCRDSLTKGIRIHPNSRPGFLINKDTQCFKGHVYKFNNVSTLSSGVMNYSWDLGDGGFSTFMHVTKTYAATGNYPVRLIVKTDKNCRDTIVKGISLFASPVSQFTINKDKQCFRGHAFHYTNSSSISQGNIVARTWLLGDGQTRSTQDVFNYSYSSEDSFDVQLISQSDKGCSDTFRKMVITLDQPVAGFTLANDSLCWYNGKIPVSNSTTVKNGILSHTWKFSDGTFDYGYTPNKSFPNQTRLYTIAYKALSTNGCSDSLTKTIQILETPVAGFNVNDTVQCLNNNTFIFTNQSYSTVPMSYLWDFGDTSTSTAQHPTKHYATGLSMSRMVRLFTANKNACSDTAELVITTTGPDPGVTVNNKTLTSNENNAGYQWVDCNKNYQAISGETGRTFTPSANGTYAVIVTSGACTDTSNCMEMNTIGLNKISRPNVVSIYPNPGSGIFELNISHDANVFIYNQLGELILETQYGAGKHKLNIAGHANGIYFMKVRTAENMDVIKLVKE